MLSCHILMQASHQRTAQLTNDDAFHDLSCSAGKLLATKQYRYLFPVKTPWCSQFHNCCIWLYTAVTSTREVEQGRWYLEITNQLLYRISIRPAWWPGNWHELGFIELSQLSQLAMSIVILSQLRQLLWRVTLDSVNFAAASFAPATQHCNLGSRGLPVNLLLCFLFCYCWKLWE